MKIQKNTVVTLRYKIHALLSGNIAGKVLDDGDVAYLHGGYDNIFAKVEQRLEGADVGEFISVDLSVEEGFGPRQPGLQRTIAKGEFPPGVKVGGQLRGMGDDGLPQMFYVMKIKGNVVHLDANHPLAGQPLRFVARVLSVREAQPQEIEHRHAHGDHGHHHG